MLKILGFILMSLPFLIILGTAYSLGGWSGVLGLASLVILGVYLVTR